MKDISRQIMVTKASGETQVFSPEKLSGSLERAGADSEIVEQIVADIQSTISNGISTQKIYKRAFALLQSKKYSTASRYKLKNAIMELGDTGFPFEHLISRVMEAQGYETQTGIVVQGRCVSHEVDVIATNNKKQILIECKYARDAGKPVSVRVPLYIRSRVEDIVLKREKEAEFKDFQFTGSIATNTRFTSDAIAYGECVGLKLLAWDYPKGNSLKEIIDREKIYPITVLNELSDENKQKLMNKGIVICRQLTSNSEVLNSLQLSVSKYNAILKEIETLIANGL